MPLSNKNVLENSERVNESETSFHLVNISKHNDSLPIMHKYEECSNGINRYNIVMMP